MKNINVIIKLWILTLILKTNITSGGFAGRSAEQASNAYRTQVTTGLTASYGAANSSGSNTTCPVCCPAGSTCSTAAGYIPSFNVYILNKNQQALNNLPKNLLPISSNITSFTNNAILTVNIFAPSNIASSTPQFFDKNYIVFYTLKSPDGSYIYTDFETFNSTSIPHYIAINQNGTPTAGTTPPPAVFTAPSAGENYSFIGNILPTTGFPTGQAAWQILNGISPLSQSFLFSLDSSSPANITVSKISGTYDAGSFSSGSSRTSFTPSTGGNGLGTLGIMLDGQNINIQFKGTTLPFTATDLQNGLILNVVITSEQSGNFNVVATLRTTDGTKMRKEALLSNSQTPLSTLPTSITIQQNSTPILTTDFLNTQISNNTNAPNAANMVLPLNLRFSISQPSGSKNIQVLMI